MKAKPGNIEERGEPERMAQKVIVMCAHFLFHSGLLEVVKLVKIMRARRQRCYQCERAHKQTPAGSLFLFFLNVIFKKIEKIKLPIKTILHAFTDHTNTHSLHVESVYLTHYYTFPTLLGTDTKAVCNH